MARARKQPEEQAVEAVGESGEVERVGGVDPAAAGVVPEVEAGMPAEMPMPTGAEASGAEADLELPEPSAENAVAPEPKADAGPPAPQEAEGGGEQVVKRRRERKPRAQRKPRPKTRRTLGTGERKPIVQLPKPEHARGRRKERRGVVVSNATDKTIVVRVETVKPDPRYKKVVRRSRKFHAHDEQNAANVGDVVRIVETRPLSKTKHWRLAEIVQEAK
jgi:small subunit ribosomal protein S17